MNTHKLFQRLAVAGLALPLAFGAFSVQAATQGYSQATALQIGTVALVILPGSQFDSLTTTDASFTVTVAAGQAFIVRTESGARILENDGLLAPCHVLTTGQNQMIIDGPRTITVTPSQNNCDTSNSANDRTPFLSVSIPNGAATYHSGDHLQVFWQTTGGTVAGVRVSLSADGGQTYSVVADNVVNNGFYDWTIPSMPTTTHARLRLDAVEQGSTKAIDISDADFVIEGTSPEVPVTPPPAPPESHPAYDPSTETSAAFSIDVDRDFPESSLPSGSETCSAGTRIKGASSAAVYYCGRDGKRHAFPNQHVHDSWFQGFNGVVTLTDSQLAGIQLGATVTYRPGVRMVKITSDPKVYAVAKNGTLRWVPDEWTAKRLYGDDWNKKIDDLSDAFFADYHIGEQVPAN